jgi:hypothetical protein
VGQGHLLPALQRPHPADVAIAIMEQPAFIEQLLLGLAHHGKHETHHGEKVLFRIHTGKYTVWHFHKKIVFDWVTKIVFSSKSCKKW